jgi:dTDP-4-amino-4,6-dideoxygalactose transaminase
MDEYYESCLSLPMYYELSAKEQTYVIDSLEEILSAAR